MATTVHVKRSIASLKLPRAVPALITLARTIVAVHLQAEAAARRASYEWQYSNDGGKTWVQAPSTLQTKTTITGLTPSATIVFRYRAVTKVGEGEWSQPTSIMVK